MISFKKFLCTQGTQFVWGIFTHDHDQPESFETSLQKQFPSIPLQFARPEQVHGHHVEYVRDGGLFPNTDGLYSCTPNLVLSVYTADCLPLVAYSPRNQSFGIVHAGWKGVQKSIVSKLFSHLSVQSRPSSPIYVDILPHICESCYTVGEEFETLFSGESFQWQNDQRGFNLQKEIFHQLDALKYSWEFLPGAKDTPVFSQMCSYESKNLPSYRRGKDKERIFSFCFLLSPAP